MLLTISVHNFWKRKTAGWKVCLSWTEILLLQGLKGNASITENKAWKDVLWWVIIVTDLQWESWKEKQAYRLKKIKMQVPGKVVQGWPSFQEQILGEIWWVPFNARPPHHKGHLLFSGNSFFSLKLSPKARNLLDTGLWGSHLQLRDIWSH